MFEREQDLSDFFTELGQALLPQEQYELMTLLLDCRNHNTCRIMPEILSVDGEGDCRLDFDIPFSVKPYEQGDLHVFGEAYALDYCAFGDVKDQDWMGFGGTYKYSSVRDAFKRWNNVQATDVVSVVQLNPHSFFVGRLVDDGIVEVIPPLKLRLD